MTKRSGTRTSSTSGSAGDRVRAAGAGGRPARSGAPRGVRYVGRPQLGHDRGGTAMNCWMGCGRLGNNVELRYTPGGQALARVLLAVDRYGKEGKKRTDW